MTPSESSLEMPSKLPNKLMWAMAIIAFIGFLDATYLTISHFGGAQLLCGVKDTCSIVTSSKYAQVFGIPVALGGAFYYLAVLIGALLTVDKQSTKIAKTLGWFTILGLLASAWFVYVQLGILHAICWYCMASATTSTLLFILGMILITKLKK